MTQKIFLTSALAMGVMAPAMAEPERVPTFPNAANNEFMQENKVYTNAATSTNMAGVYEDGATVDAVAQYTDILYNIVAGNYLAAGSEDENGTQCPQNSYCPGLTNALYNATDNQGLYSCPSEYGLSAAGASSQNDCYRTCTTADVEHSAGVTGGYYYGDNNQCAAETCVNGYHKQDGITAASLKTAMGSISSSNSDAAYVASINSVGSFSEKRSNTGKASNNGISYYGLSTSNPNTWATDLGGNGILFGIGRCSTVAGTNNDYSWSNPTIRTISELGAEGGQHCYCSLTGYKPVNGILQSFSSSWVYAFNNRCDDDTCAISCAALMSASDNSRPSGARSALLGTVDPTLASCVANTININWYNTDAEDVSANNAGTATYGSDVRTPVKAQTIKGKTFKGWRFSKPEQTNLPE